GLIAGVISAAVSFGFLKGLVFVTDTRSHHDWLVWLLPVGGLFIGLFMHYLGGHSHRGTQLVFDEIVDPGERMPRRLAPVILLASWATHLFGGSAGREGVAVQASAGTANVWARAVGLRSSHRQIVLIAAVSGAFSAVFGVPVGGWLFGLEVAAHRGTRLRAVLPSLVAAVTSNWCVQGWSIGRESRHLVHVSVVPSLVWNVLAFGIACGVVARLFVIVLRSWARALARVISWPPVRPCIGGCTVLLLMQLSGRQYLGLSLPLGDRALAGVGVLAGAFALKLVFTAVTLGSGFPGGEVTPLAISGALLGATYAQLTGGDARLMAAVGFLALYAAAMGAPWSCSVMAAEMFGASILPIVLGVMLIATSLTRKHRLHHPGEFQADQERAARE
ncbi:MAG: chloride channel protein, partial [Acidimicrobiia bacterium]